MNRRGLLKSFLAGLAGVIGIKAAKTLPPAKPIQHVFTWTSGTATNGRFADLKMRVEVTPGTPVYVEPGATIQGYSIPLTPINTGEV